MRAKVVEWLKRYVPLEIAATACSLAGGLGAAALTDNGGVIAYVATWAENVGFYGCALIRRVWQRTRFRPISLSIPAMCGALLPSAKVLVTEFGPAEVLDSFVLRPACLYLLPKLTGHLALGLVLGKIPGRSGLFRPCHSGL